MCYTRGTWTPQGTLGKTHSIGDKQSFQSYLIHNSWAFSNDIREEGEREGGRGKERGECEGQGGRRGKEEVGGKKGRGEGAEVFPSSYTECLLIPTNYQCYVITTGLLITYTHTRMSFSPTWSSTVPMLY